MNRNWRHQFWSLGKLKLSNFSVLFSLLPLLIGGFFTVVTESKAEARHKTRPAEECCVVAQSFPSESISQVDARSVELPQFPGGFYGQIYRVYVPTYSDELYRFIRQEVTSSAYMAVYRGRPVIIVTQNDLGRARRAVRELQRNGITAQMEAVSSDRVLPDRSDKILPEDNRYIVYVLIGRRQNRYALLDRVQFFDPDARVQRLGRRTVIVVRELDNRSEAQRLVNELQSNGLSGRIYVRPIESEISSNQNRFAGVKVESEIPNNVDRFTPVATQETPISTPVTAYKLVIPIDRDELAAIEAQVRQMAIDLGQANEILIEANPDRSELIIGPFNNLQTAQQWEGYLQEYGVMNALIR